MHTSRRLDNSQQSIGLNNAALYTTPMLFRVNPAIRGSQAVSNPDQLLFAEFRYKNYTNGTLKFTDFVTRRRKRDILTRFRAAKCQTLTNTD